MEINSVNACELIAVQIITNPLPNQSQVSIQTWPYLYPSFFYTRRRASDPVREKRNSLSHITLLWTLLLLFSTWILSINQSWRAMPTLRWWTCNHLSTTQFSNTKSSPNGQFSNSYIFNFLSWFCRKTAKAVLCCDLAYTRTRAPLWVVTFFCTAQMFLPIIFSISRCSQSTLQFLSQHKDTIKSAINTTNNYTVELMGYTKKNQNYL